MTTLSPAAWALLTVNRSVSSTLPHSQSHPDPPKVWFWFWGFGCGDKYPDEGNLKERRLGKLDHVGVEGPSQQPELTVPHHVVVTVKKQL